MKRGNCRFCSLLPNGRQIHPAWHSTLSALLAIFEDFSSFSCLGELNRSGTTIALAFYIENFIGAVS
jgi:hypothetical protein